MNWIDRELPLAKRAPIITLLFFKSTFIIIELLTKKD